MLKDLMICEKFNIYCFVDYKEYVIDLIGCVICVLVEMMEIVEVMKGVRW